MRIEALFEMLERDGRCRPGNPEGFAPETLFPTGEPESRSYQRKLARAREICAGCPVRLECAELAARLDGAHRHPDGRVMKARTVSGVWGGLSHEERLAAYDMERRAS